MTQNELPVGWIRCKLEDFVQILDNLRKPVNATEREKRLASAKTLYPYYGATGQVGYIDGYLTDGDYVLLGEDGAPFLDPLKPKAYKISGKTWVNNHAHILKGYGEISDEFICFCLNSVSYRPFVSGTTRLKLNQAKMKEIPCNLPPLAEQKRIVGKIEELFAEVDKGIDLLKQKQAELKKYRQSVLSAAFSGKLYKTTKWQETTFAKSFKSISPKSKIKTKDYFVKGKFPIIDQGEDYIGGYWNKEEDVITIETPLICFGDHTRRFKYIDFNFVAGADGLKIFQPKDFIPKCAYYYALALKFPNKGYARHSGYLKKCKMYIPSLSEQEWIVAEIEQRFEKADILKKSIEDALESAEKLKQSILKKAFEGKLVSQDPNDEPASVLLGRIKSEQTPKTGKKK